MKKMNADEIRNVQLGILDAVHDYCESNGLTYFLTGGTLIGAVRHQGFIPWDDDIDIMMLRKDYESFIANFNSIGSDYSVVTCFNNPKMKYPFAKVTDERTLLSENTNGMLPELGVSIDLFPVDNLPDSNKEIYKIVKQERRYKRMLGIYGITPKNRGMIKNIAIGLLQTIVKMSDLNTVSKKMNRIAMNCGYENSEKCADLVWGYSEKEIMPREVFCKAVYLPFEGKNKCVPSGYHVFLTNIYGDYMKLPPVEKQVSHHDIVAYYKDVNV